jgi:hypothetical protein
MNDQQQQRQQKTDAGQDHEERRGPFSDPPPVHMPSFGLKTKNAYGQ